MGKDNMTISDTLASTTEDPLVTLGEVDPEETGISRPFNPALINIQSRQVSLDIIIKRIREKEINLAPDFQRNEVWKNPAKSRLMESLLIRIPLPAFYMDATDEDHWLVVDGLQRLSTLREFVIDKTLVLEDVEFLKQFEGKGYDALPRNFQRRIDETQVTVYLIEKGTPADVKFNIFKRINTGGLPLSSQEIRHALHQGWVTTWLKDMAHMPQFLEATDRGIKDQRMTDRECVLRFTAFKLTPYQEYAAADIDGFLSDTMSRLNDAARTSEREREDLTRQFLRAMSWAKRIFDRLAFRKQDAKGKRYPINKALFESWAVNLDRLTDDQLAILVRQAKSLQNRFVKLSDEGEFLKAISQGTGDPAKVRLRFSAIERIIQETLE